MNKFLVFAIVLLFGFVSTNAKAETNPDIENISAETLEKMINDGANLVIIDSRRVKDYSKAHIQGAVGLPADQTTKESLAKIVPNESTKIVFYCQNPKCVASHIAAKKAADLGYKYIYVFSGGIEDWTAHKYPNQSSQATAPATPPATAETSETK